MRSVGAAVGAGLLLSAALPPFGWWPLALAGAAIAVSIVHGVVGRRRVLLGFAIALGWLVPGLWWMTEFTAPGYVLAVLFEGALVTLGITVGRGWVALPAAIVLTEALRASWPFGGVPVPTLAQTQVGGPLDQPARLGGELLLAALVVVVGVAGALAWRRRWTPAVACLAAVIAIGIAAELAPRGEQTGRLDVAAVQGGGERGTRAIDTDERIVFERHLDASADVRDADLVLWPEDVVDVEDDIDETREGDALRALAREHEATLVAGVVEGGDDAFLNFAMAWGPSGRPLGAYEKNTRVPFGEFIPFRSLVERLADVSAVPRDAHVGEGPGLLETPAGDLGVVISWEVFFADRARDAISSGGEVLLVPTNAASFSSTQMPALEVGAARLRAIETGRDVVQAAPTGFSALVTSDGEVVSQSDLGARQVLHGTVDRRSGETIYTALGDGPFVGSAALALVGATLVARRRSA